jgi:hypothetical protein
MKTLFFTKNGIGDKLFIVFNSHANLASDDSIKGNLTQLEGYNFFKSHENYVIWVAEERCSWYTNNEIKIQEFITNFIKKNNIKKIILFGLSAGGFAALRFACIISEKFHAQSDIEIVSIAINTQTGFRDDLIAEARHLGHKTQFKKGILGQDPILLKTEDYGGELFPLEKIDLIFQMNFYSNFIRDTKFHILYDSLNPYEKVFAEDLRGDNIYKHRFPYGMSHGDGCKQIFKILTEYNLLQKFIA